MKYFLTSDKYSTLVERGVNFIATADEGFDFKHITAEQLFEYLPHQLFIEGDECRVVTTADYIDGKKEYIVSFDRYKDSYTCISFHGEHMIDAVYDALIYYIDNFIVQTITLFNRA